MRPTVAAVAPTFFTDKVAQHGLHTRTSTFAAPLIVAPAATVFWILAPGIPSQCCKLSPLKLITFIQRHAVYFHTHPLLQCRPNAFHYLQQTVLSCQFLILRSVHRIQTDVNRRNSSLFDDLLILALPSVPGRRRQAALSGNRISGSTNVSPYI